MSTPRNLHIKEQLAHKADVRLHHSEHSANTGVVEGSPFGVESGVSATRTLQEILRRFEE